MYGIWLERKGSKPERTLSVVWFEAVDGSRLDGDSESVTPVVEEDDESDTSSC